MLYKCDNPWAVIGCTVLYKCANPPAVVGCTVLYKCDYPPAVIGCTVLYKCEDLPAVIVFTVRFKSDNPPAVIGCIVLYKCEGPPAVIGYCLYCPPDGQAEKNKKKWLEKFWKSCIFVPPTPGSVLKKEMQKKEEELRAGGREAWPIKIIETAGKTLEQTLVKTDPFNDNSCYDKHRKSCE